MNENDIYKETLSSRRTIALFAVLMFIFFLLFLWQANISGSHSLRIALLSLSVLFLFYMLNYRTLHIYISSDALMLRFGIFTWTVPHDNIAGCTLDDNLPKLTKYGGAGIHFFIFKKRYRVSFNFLEYSRVVVTFKKARGLVTELSFSTRQPDEIIRLVQQEKHERSNTKKGFALV